MLPEAVLTLNPDDVPLLAQTGGVRAWRIEVTGQGRYWQWRRGRGADRVSRYGGKFNLLSEERKGQYHEHIKRKARQAIRSAAAADAG